MAPKTQTEEASSIYKKALEAHHGTLVEVNVTVPQKIHEDFVQVAILNNYLSQDAALIDLMSKADKIFKIKK